MKMVLRVKKHHRSILVECNIDGWLVKSEGLFPLAFWIYAKVYLLQKSFEITAIVCVSFSSEEVNSVKYLVYICQLYNMPSDKDAKLNAIQR